jgi:nucleoid-associated protein YgaU
MIQKWKDQKSPVRVIVASNGQLNMDCTIEDLVIDFERPGHIGDAWFTFKLVEYKAPSIRKTKVTQKKTKKRKTSTKGKTNKTRSAAKKPKRPPIHVVKRNDTLGAIAKRYYGSADYKYYNAIYTANKSEFAKWHKRYKPRSRFTIFPTMKLKIPKKP